MKKMTYVQDNDSHWYLIPYEEKDRFNKLLEEAESNDDHDEFCDAFDQYRGSSPHGEPVFVEE